jgi:hypothetical protein
VSSAQQVTDQAGPTAVEFTPGLGAQG